MQIICTKTYRFPLRDGRDFWVSPSPLPQTVPEEIKNTLLFGWATKDHSIREIILAEEVKTTDSGEKPAKSAKAAK